MYNAILGEFMDEVEHFLFVPFQGIQVDNPDFIVQFFVDVLEDDGNACFLFYACEELDNGVSL